MEEAQVVNERTLQQHEVGDYFLHVLSGFASAAYSGTYTVEEFDKQVEFGKGEMLKVFSDNNLKVSKKDINKVLKIARDIVEIKERYGK